MCWGSRSKHLSSELQERANRINVSFQKCIIKGTAELVVATAIQRYDDWRIAFSNISSPAGLYKRKHGNSPERCKRNEKCKLQKHLLFFGKWEQCHLQGISQPKMKRNSFYFHLSFHIPNIDLLQKHSTKTSFKWFL